MENARFFSFVLAAAILAGCSWMPKVKVPFTGGTPAVEDPKVSFDVRRPLDHGHTLKLVVYRNLLSHSRAFQGSVMVDQQGIIHFKDAGDVRVGGRNAYEAVRAVEAAFSRLQGDSTVSVQLLSVEDVPLVTIIGAVRSPGVVQWFDGMTTDSALTYVGGRTGHSGAHAVHVTRDGARHFHAESSGVTLMSGDVVNFSKDI